MPERMLGLVIEKAIFRVCPGAMADSNLPQMILAGLALAEPPLKSLHCMKVAVKGAESIMSMGKGSPSLIEVHPRSSVKRGLLWLERVGN